MQVMSVLWARWSTPLLHLTQNDQQHRQSPGNLKAKAVSFNNSLMIALARGESLRPTYEQSSKTSGRSRERLADAHGSVHAKTSRNQETRRNAARGIERCGERRRHSGQLTKYSPATAAHVSLTNSRTRRWKLASVTGDNTVVASASRDPYSFDRKSISFPSALP